MVKSLGEGCRFTVCNVDCLGIHKWQEPPYLEVAYTTVNYYQTDSLYKKMIANHASPTLVVIGAKLDENRVTLGGCVQIDREGATVSLMETSAAGMAETRNAKAEMRESLKYVSMKELVDSAGGNSSGEALRLRTASGTATIRTVDMAGAKAIEEQLVFAAVWAGASEEEASARISYEADTSYLSSDFDLSSVVSLMAANQSAEGGTGFLSNQNLYAVLDRAMPGTLSSYEDNEVMKTEIL